MFSAKQCIISFLQTLLQNNASAAFFSAQLSGTEWRVSDVSNFLSKVKKDHRPAGSSYTWRDVFNETDQAIQTISRFMEVSVCVVTCNLFDWFLFNEMFLIKKTE